MEEGQAVKRMRHVLALRIAAGALCLGLGACASVPKEAVTLSYAVGQDLEQLQRGYRETIRLSFEQMRKRGLAVIDEVWTPVYLKTFVEAGELKDIVREENWEDLQGWARQAIKAIEEKRKGFLEPLNAREQALLNKVDEAFGRTQRANAAVTAHLNSVLKVQQTQEQVLDAFGLKDLTVQISDAIVAASDAAAKATAAIEGESAPATRDQKKQARSKDGQGTKDSTGGTAGKPPPQKKP